MSSINVTYKSLSDVDSITIEDLNINIGSLSILEDTYFNIAKGINYGLVSPNGHGKTTLLKTLAYKIPIININIHMVKQENTNSILIITNLICWLLVSWLRLLKFPTVSLDFDTDFIITISFKLR